MKRTAIGLAALLLPLSHAAAYDPSCGDDFVKDTVIKVAKKQSMGVEDASEQSANFRRYTKRWNDLEKVQDALKDQIADKEMKKACNADKQARQQGCVQASECCSDPNAVGCPGIQPFCNRQTRQFNIAGCSSVVSCFTDKNIFKQSVNDEKLSTYPEWVASADKAKALEKEWNEWQEQASNEAVFNVETIVTKSLNHDTRAVTCSADVRTVVEDGYVLTAVAFTVETATDGQAVVTMAPDSDR